MVSTVVWVFFFFFCKSGAPISTQVAGLNAVFKWHQYIRLKQMVRKLVVADYVFYIKSVLT